MKYLQIVCSAICVVQESVRALMQKEIIEYELFDSVEFCNMCGIAVTEED